MNIEEIGTDLNSTENRKKPLIAIDRIDIAIYHDTGKGYSQIRKPTLPNFIQSRIHKKSYALSKNGVFLGRGKGSGFTNGTKLFFSYLNVPYECSGRKARYFMTKNQIPDDLMQAVYEIEKTMPFRNFQLDLCEKLLNDIRNNLVGVFPHGVTDYRCSGIEAYFEISDSRRIDNIRERIYKYLSTTLTAVPITRSPIAGQEGPLQEWSVYLNEFRQKIPARITTYSKGNRIRVELKIDKLNCQSSTPEALISYLKRYTNEASSILTKISDGLLEQQCTPGTVIIKKEEFTQQVLELISGKTTMNSIALFCDQIQKDGYTFMPKSQAQYKAYYYFLKKMKAVGVIFPVKASSINGSTIQLSSRKKGLFSLNPDWQLALKKAIQKRNRTQRKSNRLKKKIESNTDGPKPHRVTLTLQDQLKKMSVHKQSRILSILTKGYCGFPIELPYPKTVSEYLELHSLNMYRLQNTVPMNKPNL